MAYAIAADLAGTGVTVNALAPGDTANQFSLAGHQEFHDVVRDWTPVRWGRPDDMCGAALLSASDAGTCINGRTLYVDGGIFAATRSTSMHGEQALGSLSNRSALSRGREAVSKLAGAGN
jgi:gluconate 5-dehydrogenase